MFKRLVIEGVKEPDWRFTHLPKPNRAAGSAVAVSERMQIFIIAMDRPRIVSNYGADEKAIQRYAYLRATWGRNMVANLDVYTHHIAKAVARRIDGHEVADIENVQCWQRDKISSRLDFGARRIAVYPFDPIALPDKINDVIVCRAVRHWVHHFSPMNFNLARVGLRL
jgi:hypothetical protein